MPLPRSFAFVVLISACAIGKLTAQETNSAKPAPSPDAGIEMQDVVIGKGGDMNLRGVILAPANATATMPGVIWIHGGGWKGGTYKGNLTIPKFLAAHGFVCLSIEYRVVKIARWPAQIEDCKLGVRWFRANAARYHVDPNRIAVGGESAGGHLALCVGTMTDVAAYEGTGGTPGESSAVQAVVDFYGPADFVTPGIYSAQAMKLTEELMGKPLEGNEDLWKSGSPAHQVKPGAPPMLLIHGTADGLVPMGQSLAMAEALKKANVPYELIVAERGRHGLCVSPSPNPSMKPSESEIMNSVVAFLDKYLKGQTP